MATFRHRFPPWERFIPKVGIICSQCGNGLFPAWEYLASMNSTGIMYGYVGCMYGYVGIMYVVCIYRSLLYCIFTDSYIKYM